MGLGRRGRVPAGRRPAWRPVLLAASLGLVLLLPLAARAQIGSARYSSIIVDAGTGDVLEAVNPDEPRYPASLTKMMTIYMLFEALRDRRLTLDDLVPVSAHAASMEPEKLGLVPGMRLTVQQALLGLVTLSANDAAAALGELMGGDEDRFAEMMTLRARALGMNRTLFRNASGLPDPDQVSTARDLALLARHLIHDFPEEYGYFSTPGFVFGRRTILNHDRMLVTYPGADGMKTGYTRAAGHNIVTSAQHGEVRLIGVVLGAGSNAERDIHMAALLDQGFEQMGAPAVPHREVPLLARLPGLVTTAQAAALTIPASARARLAEPARERALTVRRAAPRHDVGGETPARRAAALVRRGGEPPPEEASIRRLGWRAPGHEPGPRDILGACARPHPGCVPHRSTAGQLASR